MMWKRFLHEDAGATSIEYSLIAMLVGVGLIAALVFTSDRLLDLYQGIAEHEALAH